MVWGWSSRSTTAAPPFERAGYSRGTYGTYAGDGYAGGGGGSGYSVGSGGYSQGGYSQSGYSQAGAGGWSSAMHPAASSSYQGGHQSGGFLESFSGLKSADNSAALSALTLLSFLYFLNMLQNQLLSSGSQTLVFTVGGAGSGNGTFVGRRRRRRDADVEVWGLNFETLHTNEFQQHLLEKFWVSEDELPDVVGADSGAGRPPCNVTAPRQDELLKMLPPHLVELFAKCRDVVTCAFKHQATPDDATAASCIRSVGASPGECDEIVRALVPHEPK